MIQKIDRVSSGIINTFAPRGHFRIIDTEFDCTVEDIDMHRTRIVGCVNYARPVGYV